MPLDLAVAGPREAEGRLNVYACIITRETVSYLCIIIGVINELTDDRFFKCEYTPLAAEGRVALSYRELCRICAFGMIMWSTSALVR